jgi:hypothetical protein
MEESPVEDERAGALKVLLDMASQRHSLYMLSIT